MLPRPYRIRRARRTDFVAVMEILSSCHLAVPPPDRATLRRFRNLVADLGSDLYVATVDERLVGVVHTTYARQVATYPFARLELLAVVPDARCQGIGTGLARHAEARARQRDCVRIGCDLSHLPAMAITENTAFFSKSGWTAAGSVAFLALTPRPDSTSEPCK